MPAPDHPAPDHLAHLEADALAVADVLRTADPGARVPACDWTLGDLARHLGVVHRWATTVVRTGERAPMPEDPHVADADLADWLAQGAGALLAVLAQTPPDRPCWTFSGPGTVAWWRRRQALETAVHRVDAERAAGRPYALADDLAEDGVAEVLEVMLPRQVRLQRAPEPATGLRLVSTTSGRAWQLGPEPASSVLSGSPGDLLLVLWRRLPRTAPGVVAGGDLVALDALLGTALTP